MRRLAAVALTFMAGMAATVDCQVRGWFPAPWGHTTGVEVHPLYALPHVVVYHLAVFALLGVAVLLYGPHATRRRNRPE